MVFFNTQISLLKSRKILEEVIGRLKLNDLYAKREHVAEITVEQAYEILNASIEAVPDRNTQLVTVTVFDRDGVEASDIANKIAQVYQEYRNTRRKEKEGSGLDTLRDKLTQQQKDVDSIKTNVAALQVELKVPLGVAGGGGVSPFESLNAAVINRLDAERTATKTSYERLKSLYTKLKETPPEELPSKLVSVSPGPVAELSTLIGQYNQAEIHKTKLSELGTEHPEVSIVVAMLAKIKEQISREVKGILGGYELKMQSDLVSIQNLDKDIDALRVANAKRLSAINRSFPRNAS